MILDIKQYYINIKAILPRSDETIKYLIFDMNKQTQNKGFEKDLWKTVVAMKK